MENREQWLAERKLGIGGSDAPAVLGLSKWRTPLEVYQEKTGEIDTSGVDSPAMYWGRTLEPVVRQRYSDEEGVTVIVPDAIVSEKYPFMRANIDGYTNDGRLIEIKTARFPDGWGEPGTDEIPQMYLIQVQHCMIVTGLQVADVPVLISGQDYRKYIVEEDRELQQMIIDIEADFWNNHVLTNIPPEPVSLAEVQRRYVQSQDSIILANSEVRDAVAELNSVKRDKKQLEIDEERLKTIIMKFMGSNDKLMHGDRLLTTWKSAKPSMRFDAKAFKAANPDLHKEFTKAGKPSRRFLVK
ncbi:YqaJ viral recombinase family protein [Candidatus Pacearchaeota archaeon]|nr:YqaJ viral recombinase family protein [Candidatus Pacearchaeota archaeon]